MSGQKPSPRGNGAAVRQPMWNSGISGSNPSYGASTGFTPPPPGGAPSLESWVPGPPAVTIRYTLAVGGKFLWGQAGRLPD